MEKMLRVPKKLWKVRIHDLFAIMEPTTMDIQKNPRQEGTKGPSAEVQRRLH